MVRNEGKSTFPPFVRYSTNREVSLSSVIARAQDNYFRGHFDVTLPPAPLHTCGPEGEKKKTGEKRGKNRTEKEKAAAAPTWDKHPSKRGDSPTFADIPIKNLIRRRSSLILFKKRTDRCRFFLREFGSMHGLPPATGEKVCSPFLTPLGASLSSAHCYRLLLLSVHLRLSSQEEESASSLSSPLPILAVVSPRRGAPPILHYSSSRSRSVP